jgi:hypothetical protein
LGEPEKSFRVIEAYQSPYPDSIPFQKGERVAVGREFTDDPDWRGWIWCEGAHGKQAWVPEAFLEIQAGEGVFLSDYDALELSIFPGEVLKVTEIVNGFGMAQKGDGSRGWVPMRHLEPVELPGS